MLSDEDERLLKERWPNYAVATKDNMTCVTIPSYELPEGYDHTEADLLLRLGLGFPDTPPDMWWFSPAVKLGDGRAVRATDTTEHHLGRDWQRWSRHLNSNDWIPGNDNLESFLAIIGQDLLRKEPA